MSLDPGSRARLTPRALPLFDGQTLFDRVGRVVCRANCLPRKELFESWEIARRARRRFRGGRVVDMACGHALVAHLMLVLDDTSPSSLAVDRSIPKSAAKLGAAFVDEWPRLRSRVEIVQTALAKVELRQGDLVVSSHACGSLTDDILEMAMSASARVVVLPCCHDKATGDQGGVGGWLDPAMAMDVTRAARLRARGYDVYTQTIPEAITTKNRLLLAGPR